MQKFCYKSVQPSALEHFKTTFISLFYFEADFSETSRVYSTYSLIFGSGQFDHTRIFLYTKETVIMQ